MTETTPDWGVLAAALVAEGVDAGLVYGTAAFYGCGDARCSRCRETAEHLWEERCLLDFTDPGVLEPLVEAWRRQDPDQRRYSVRSVGYGSCAEAVVIWGDEDRWARARDDPASVAEALARALLAWAEGQEVTP